jgi:DNA-binding CsgD family transcriptional regulator
MALRVVVLADEPAVRDRLAGEIDALEDAVVVAAGAVGDEDLTAFPADVAVWHIGTDLPDARTHLARGPVLDHPTLVLGPAGLGPEAVGSGAGGYLRHDAADARLRAALHAVAAGLQVVEPPEPADVPAEDGAVEDLTPREMEVLQLLAEGLPNKEIARLLHISEHTVKFHVTTIFGKLGARSRTEAVTRAARQGLLIL